MKVCFFAHNSSSHQNGATLSLENIVNELVKRGIEVIIIFPNKSVKIFKESDRLKCFFVSSFSMRVPIHKKGFISNLKGRLKCTINWFSMRKTLSILKKEKPDLIHINGLDSGIGAKIASKLEVPYIWHIRQFLEEDFGLRLYNQKRVYDLLNKADSIIAISNSIKEKFEKELDRDLELIYNGIPIEKYHIKTNNRFANKQIGILLAGRINKNKGQLDAVKAVGHLVEKGFKNIYLILAGDAQDIKYLRKIQEFIIKHNLNEFIRIIDYVEELKQLRTECDIGLVCSKKEAFGRVTIETMLSNMLVIGANSGGTAELIDDDITGLLYQEGDYISLANKIEYAIANKEEMKTIIRSGYKTVVENYSVNRVVDQILDLYKEVLRTRLDKEVK
ncbi:glycosyltransferase family 4 protein [Virgibacillus sp. SK37]|uniref:glycosyltransferase family 4 protein n=1 Tax=Virgibacillus sp. SK37 TaxID=403957 RepID=UPI0004D10B64|nr:glycosyltransferase family 4 protein [Virgibacillus sp. SK37]AIF44547.1 glycosyl transferase family 1 [Virgibacillus sp. SK37]